MIRIVTDSVSDIPASLVKELGITVVPLTVNFEDHSYKDGIDLTSKEFFKLMKENHKLPTTSQVAPGEFVKVFEDIISKGDTIIAIFLSSHLSGTYASAITAKNMVDNGDIHVIDSEGVTLGQGLLVIEAARMVQRGCSKEEIIDYVNYMKENIEYKLALDTLENLYKGGRLSATSAFMGNLLNIKPILTMKQGKLVHEDKARGRKKALRWIIDWIIANKIDLSSQTIGINHANDEAFAQELIKLIKENFTVREIIISEVGAVVGTHSGQGAVGIYFLRKYT